MATPWTPPRRSPAERPWLGTAMLAAVPLLSLILIRMLWSGSSLWFLTAGISLLGAAAVFFLARRPAETEYGRPTATQETSRAPLILAALGVLFLAMLLLPNFAGGGDSDRDESSQRANQSSSTLNSEVSGAQQAPRALQPTAQLPRAPVQQPPAAQAPQEAPALQPPAQEAPVVEGETYVVQDGDNLWDIALRFGTTVDAIIAANELEDPEALQIGQEIIIPAAGAGTTQ